MSVLDRLVVQGDCVDVLRGMDKDSVDACVCDPPYELAFMGKGWDKAGVAFDPKTWAAVLRVLKPGAHLLAFGGARTFHRLTCAIEDAGFEVRDCFSWLYASGFPKSLNVAKAIDKAGLGGSEWDGFGTALKPAWEPIILARKPLAGTVVKNVLEHGTGAMNIDACRIATSDGLGGGAYAKNPTARSQMWGADAGNSWKRGGAGDFEQPEGRYPANVLLTHHLDCEVVGTRTVKGDPRETGNGKRGSGFADVGAEKGDAEPNAPVYGDQEVEVFRCHPDCPVRMLDEQTGNLKKGGDLSGKEPSTSFSGEVYGDGKQREAWRAYGDSGGASRFYFCAKASTRERNAGLDELEALRVRQSGHADERVWDIPGSHAKRRPNNHPTVKPVELMCYLVRLVAPPDGVVLDPFTGSGTTGVACVQEGFRFVGIEREADYCRIARLRIEHAASELEEQEEVAA